MQKCRILCHAFLGNLPPKNIPPIFDFLNFPQLFFRRHLPPPVNGVDATLHSHNALQTVKKCIRTHILLIQNSNKKSI